jgi:hypothetical protein
MPLRQMVRLGSLAVRIRAAMRIMLFFVFPPRVDNQ